ncbi:MAG TPA: DNA repair protein RecO [Anseongella sp.]
MLHKTRGIVLKTTRFRNSSVIAQVFTERFGLQPYLINGVRKPRSSISLNILQPLHLLEMVVYHKPTVSIQRIKEIRNHPVYFSVPLDVIKSTITLFLCEVLYKLIRKQSGEDLPLFQYIFSSMEWLDHHRGNVADFHLVFLTGLTRYLGFFPDIRAGGGKNDYFDLLDGKFTTQAPTHSWYLSPPTGAGWRKLIETDYQQLPDLKFSVDERKQLLDALLEFYSLHLEDFGNIRSREVLQELFA